MAHETILIVDDNATNLKLLKVLMTVEGYEVHTAMDAKEAMAVLNQCNPVLILMDVQLPDIDGLELARTLKANPEYRNTIIIAVTAYAMKGDEAKALAAGCDGYIAKPIDVKELPKIIAAYLTKQKVR